MLKMMAGVVIMCLSLSTAFATDKKPNIVFILADDLGWSDTSLYTQNDFYETPNIERLASIGVTFTHSYTNSPVCSPTRASILTGQTPARHGSTEPAHGSDTLRLRATINRTAASSRKSVRPMTATRLDTALPTLSSLLKQDGYQTAHFGKWHLGAEPYSALDHGFDIDIPHYEGSGPAGGYLAPWRFAPNLQPQPKGQHIDIRLAEEASKWLRDLNDDAPFYLNFWTFSVHSPFNAASDYVEYFRSKVSPYNSQQSPTYAAMVKHFDDSIGILLDTLEQENLLDNTIIVFSSDNGGNHYSEVDDVRPTSNLPFRYGKATNFEGGMRVPTIIYWPELHNQSHAVSTPIQSVDFFPTLLNGAGVTWPASHVVDGVDIRPLLSGDAIEEQAIINYYPAEPRTSHPGWMPASASVIFENWKLIKTFHYGLPSGDLYHLYDLSKDFGERTSIAEQYPDKVALLESILDAHLDDSFAIVPAQNPNYVEGAFDYGLIDRTLNGVFLHPDAELPKVSGRSIPQTASVGDVVEIKLQSDDIATLQNLTYEQYVGPKVNIEKVDENTLRYLAPEVYTETFIGVALLNNDDSPAFTFTKISPTEIEPSISARPNSQEIAKGDILVIDVQAVDLNLEILDVSVESDLGGVVLPTPPVRGQYEVMIPADTQATEMTITFSVTDGKASDSTSVTIPIKEPSAGGSTSYLTLLLILYISFWRLKIGRFFNR
ncbi:sulfatase [Agaribacter marinus]|uniref:Sulfatase N-terminal domain-containing protein n=1 Tax=Agaribacter marinus TaxID=1431249 RepID=A0AA37WI80_9ALTE|nr:sulfatase [Agaribacter marinus]GLR71941.1 hypothetical protein GCM10007852_28490 [Agaribacter marinus]